MAAPWPSLVYPTTLKPGDTLRVASVAGKVRRTPFDKGIARLRKAGFAVEYRAESLASDHEYLAGPTSQRLAELVDAFASDQVGGIVLARGGFGSMHLLEEFDAAAAAATGKPFLGFSDNTALHLVLNRAGLVTFHGPVVTAIGGNSLASARSAVDALTGGLLSGELTGVGSIGPTASGRLFGGNLSLLASCLPIGDCRPPEGALLFIEEVGEPLYRIDRMVTGLRLAGLLDQFVGFALGSFQDCGEDSARARAAAVEALLPLDKPIVYGLPVGHSPDDLTLPLGGPVTLDTGTVQLRWSFPDA